MMQDINNSGILCGGDNSLYYDCIMISQSFWQYSLYRRTSHCRQ